MSERETIAKWMIANSLATGHGDTVDDLLSEAAGQIAELRARVAKLEAATLALADRLDEIDAHPSFQSLFTITHVHGGCYNGPSWAEPLKAVRAALKDAPG